MTINIPVPTAEPQGKYYVPTETKPTSRIIWHQRPQPPNQPLFSEHPTESEESSSERNDGESTASLQCKISTPVFTQWNNALATPSSPFFPTLMCIPVCRCSRDNLTHGYKSLKLQKHLWHLTNFWPELKVKFWFGVINNLLPTGREFPISRCCFVPLRSLNLVFPKRVMTETSVAVRYLFISSKCWTQHQQPNCLQCQSCFNQLLISPVVYQFIWVDYCKKNSTVVD